MMILNGMIGQNPKPQDCVVILIMKRVTHTILLITLLVDLNLVIMAHVTPILTHLWMLSILLPGGGALTLERGMGMCRGHGPLFSGQSPLPSPPIYRQCAALVPPVFNF